MIVAISDLAQQPANGRGAADEPAVHPNTVLLLLAVSLRGWTIRYSTRRGWYASSLPYCGNTGKKGDAHDARIPINSIGHKCSRRRILTPWNRAGHVARRYHAADLEVCAGSTRSAI